MRLAMYLDQVFWSDGHVFSTDESFILFPASFADFVEEIVFIGREAPRPGQAPYVLEHPSVKVSTLEHYPSLWDTRAFLQAVPRACRRLRELIRSNSGRWDAMLIDGPHPIGQVAARECDAVGLPFALMVRQNLIEQMRAHSGAKKAAAMAAAALLEWDFRRLARGRTVFTVGMEMAHAYTTFTGRVHDHFPCLVDEAQFDMLSSLSRGSDPTRLLCVCRLSPEKGHRYLFAALDDLRKRGIFCRVDVVGSGSLDRDLRREVAALGLERLVTFHGYVPYGPALFELYQRAGAFVLPSLTEGFPQVINESLSIGLPTIATTVGGIPAFLRDGETGLLVPPADVPALARAIERAVTDVGLRARLSRNGRELMRRNTLEVNRSRVIGALRNEVCK